MQQKEMMKLFNNGDEEYFQWMNENPEGYVLNTAKESGTSFFILHKSNCHHITKSEKLNEGAYTKNQWIKVGALDVNEIVRYCTTQKKNFKGQLKDCRSCNPEYIFEILYPDEESFEITDLKEGGKKAIIINSYERNTKARKKCIEHYGLNCQVCNINFEKQYGKIGKGFIHVHHLKMISTSKAEYTVNPIEDLIPLCPNCHAMIHKKDPPLGIDKLKELIKKGSS